jgi:hypothetical protein
MGVGAREVTRQYTENALPENTDATATAFRGVPSWLTLPKRVLRFASTDEMV